MPGPREPYRRSNGRWLGPLIDPVRDPAKEAPNTHQQSGLPPKEALRLLGPDGEPFPAPAPEPFGFWGVTDG